MANGSAAGRRSFLGALGKGAGGGGGGESDGLPPRARAAAATFETEDAELVGERRKG